MPNAPLSRLRHYVSGAIARLEAVAITELPSRDARDAMAAHIASHHESPDAYFEAVRREDRTMKTYSIGNAASGQDLGIYRADSRLDAYSAMRLDAGAQPHEEIDDDITVTRIHVLITVPDKASKAVADRVAAEAYDMTDTEYLAVVGDETSVEADDEINGAILHRALVRALTAEDR